MKFPYTLIQGVSPQVAQRFRVQHGEVFVHEGLWRRHQDERNAHLSQRRTDQDVRRKIVYVRETYTILDRPDGTCDLVLLSVFLWVLILCPDNEGYEYRRIVNDSCLEGGWKKIHRGFFARDDLRVSVRSRLAHPRDEARGRKVLTGYSYFEFAIGSERTTLTEEEETKVWHVLDTGMRRPDVRGEPTIITDAREILQHLPVQLEIGSGPSMEIGIPPLHALHGVYGLSDVSSGFFRLTPDRDVLFRGVTRHPERFYRTASKICASSVSVSLGVFYPLVKQMYDAGHFVGPVITHNFDGILQLIGVPFDKVRRYDEVYMDSYPFDVRAKALLVVGVHADRRKIQAAARRARLPVLYIDPEGFEKVDGFVPYPLESPQCGDYLYRCSANAFAAQVQGITKIRS